MNTQYRALTRKYRPQSFEDVVSQEHVSNTLKNAIRSNRLSHAYMFCGPRGVGKTTMARVLARAVNQVEDAVDGEALGRTLNIVEIDAASNRRIDDIRSLKEVIRVPPQNGTYKIFIIDEVHMLTTESFNALLKTLEEPPPHVIFIFATTEPHKVLPTILSRVQRFDFKRIGVAEIVDRLKKISEIEEITIDEESLHVIAKRADGALRDALGLLDQAVAFCGSEIGYKELLQALNVVDREDLFVFTDAVRQRDVHAGLSLIHELQQSGTDIQEFLVSLSEHLRNLYVALGSDRLYLLEGTEETKKRYVTEASHFTEKDLMRMLHLVSEAQFRMKEVQQPRIHFEILMLKLIHMTPSKDLDTLLQALEEVKKKPHKEPGKPVKGKPAEQAEPTERRSSVSKAQREEAPSSRVQPEGPSPVQLQSEESSPSPGQEPPARGEKRGGPSPAKSPQEEAPFSNPQRAKSSPSSGRVTSATEELYGKPSLGTGPRISTTLEESSTDSIESTGPADSAGRQGINGIEDVIEGWGSFLETMKKQAPQVLYFQMQRVKLSSLNGRKLEVFVDNEFARQLLDENQILIGRILKEEFGSTLKIQCRVERETDSRPKSLNPYEQFREIQKKDPHIRTLIELFGAELEY